MHTHLPFIEQLKSRFLKPLPGESTQFLMAPFSRQRIHQIDPEKYNPQKSAVLILLYPIKNSIYTLLIQRPLYDGVHSGQVAFPGGRFEESDINLKTTALREAFEEVGIPIKEVEIIGQLTDLYIPPSNFLVTPFIGYVNLQPNFISEKKEVEKIIPVDLFSLNDIGIKFEKIITHSSGNNIKTPFYDIDGLTVWGATAMIISELNVIVEESKQDGF